MTDRHSASSSSIGSGVSIEQIYFGDFLGVQPKPTGVFRGVSCQLGGLPTDHNDPKHHDLIQAIKLYDMDVVALQEVGINFNSPGVYGSWRQRLGWNTWLDGHTTKTVNAWNTHQRNRKRQQYGGTAIISCGHTSFYSAGAGVDPSRLGRWCWSRYQGQNGVFLRVVSFYRPCAPSGDPHALSVHSQHRQYLQNQDDDRHPRQAFMEDFLSELTAWLAMGDQLIICGDINEDILSDAIATYFSDLGLRHLIFSRHNHTSAPPTYYRNTGNTAIDGIWASPSLDLLRGGYLEKGDFPGDHRPIWFEVSYAQAFGRSLPPIWRPQARRLQLRDPRCVARYQKSMKQLTRSKRITHRQYLLESTIGPTMTPSQLHESNSIDRDLQKCQEESERKCRKLRMGNVQFSDATSIPRLQVAFWKLTLSRRRGIYVRSRLWQRARDNAKITEAAGPLSIHDIQTRITTSIAAYKLAKKTDGESRLKFIETFPLKQQKRILRVEEQRRQARVSRSITKKTQGGTVSRILRSDMVDGTETITECSTKEDVEAVLFPVNEAKYKQCNNSPFLQQPLLADFGFDGNTIHTDEVLDGTYVPPPGTDPYTCLLLNHMTRPTTIPLDSHLPPPVITTEDHKLSWKRAKEYTTSGKSGIHFGHYKAQAEDDELAALDASRRSIHYSTGETLQRWLDGVDVMLLKASGDLRAHKLRTILLMEADFNMNNKKMSREGMWVAEAAGVIAPEQGGGRRKHRVAECMLTSQLITDDSRFKRKAMAVCSNDAKGCYDRIVHSVAYICLRRIGIPSPPLLSMLKTIQNMTHYIRTAYGDSNTSYGPSLPPETPFMGLLQGNGASGTGWTAVCTVMIEAMRSQGYGYKSISALTKQICSLVGSAFVDDTDLFHSGDTNLTTGAAVKTEMQTVLDHWDNMLRSTGGGLDKEKSYWYLLDYERRNGHWGYKSPDSLPGDITLYSDESLEKEPIERLPPSEARRALGIMSRPDGKMKEQRKHLRAKGEVWAANMNAKKIRMDDAWYCLSSSITKTINYPLVHTTFTREDCKHIMAPVLQAGLHAIHVQRKLPRALVYGPIKYQGIGIEDPWTLQLIEHLQCILRHGTRPTPNGQFIRSNMENLVLELGSATPFWDLNYDEWKCLATSSWIKYTWRDLHDSPLSLRGPLTMIPPQRHNDIFLMDVFITKQFSPDQLILLNEIRMYKQITRLSDIVTADGTSLDPDAFTDSPPLSPTPFIWPRCYRPTANQLSFWTHALKTCFLPPHAQHRRITSPLGPFLHTATPHWTWWFSPSQNCLYQSSNDEWYQWLPSPTGPARFHQNGHPWLAPLPLDILRASVTHHPTRPSARLLNTGLQDPPPAIPPVTSFADRIASLPPELKWAIDFISLPDGTDHIAEAIQNSHCFAVTDASLKYTTGATAFTLVSHTNHGRITAVNTVPGPLDDGDSYRSELSGIYGILVLIHLFCVHYNITHGAVHVRCDNESSLRVFDPWFIPDPSDNSFDLINSIWYLLQESPLVWTGEHVKGHQDETGRTMDRFETLNCEMDALAKTYRNNLVAQQPQLHVPHFHLHLEGWSIWHDEEKLASPGRTQLYDHIYAPITKRYWTTSHHLAPTPRITPTSAPMIDWLATQALMKALSPSKQRWCTKHGSENCGVGITLQYWRKQDDNECPRCGAPEDTTHVLRCTGQASNDTWNTNIAALIETMAKYETPLLLQEAIVSRLEGWRRDEPPVNDPQWPLPLLILIQAQDTIGWKNFMEGLPSRLWIPHMTTHYTHINSKLCPKDWLLKTLKAAHHLAWSQWQHRNQILHEDDKPRQRRAILLLHDAIRREYTTGIRDLPQSDHHHFRCPLGDTLLSSTHSKQAWYLNVIAARQRRDRRAILAGSVRDVTTADPRLTHWISTNRLR